MSQVNEQELLNRAEEVQKKADVYKELIFAHEIFKHKSKAYLAALKVQSKKTSDVAAETTAMATQEWQNYINEEMNILQKAGRAKIEMEAAQVRYEAMRSALSAKKTEIKSFS